MCWVVVEEVVVVRGVPSCVPDDGLTTRERRDRAVLAVNTGEGKGKSTAAFGMALRAWNAGLSVVVFQFVKSPKWKVGEEAVLRRLGQLHEEDPAVGAPVEWHKMGSGWSWTRSNSGDVEMEQAEVARQGWVEVARRLGQEQHDFYVLDEFTYPLDWGWVDVDEVVETLRARPGKQHVVVTGRRAPAALVDAADLVTEMTKVKHPFDVGQKGQRGIEW
nr:cob(I)yrinic acid a,c-diamide adenosyltransferase [Dermatophilus congolensis]